MSERRFTISYSGRKVGPGFDPPPMQDIAICLGRICRFSGNCKVFYPVLLHSFVVADLVPPPAKVYALLHDASECVLGDIPSPHKATFQKQFEGEFFSDLIRAHDLPALTANVASSVHKADKDALIGEFFTVGPYGIEKYAPSPRNFRADRLIEQYLAHHQVEDCIRPDGEAVLEFHRRLSLYKNFVERAHENDNCGNSAD